MPGLYDGSVPNELLDMIIKWIELMVEIKISKMNIAMHTIEACGNCTDTLISRGNTYKMSTKLRKTIINLSCVSRRFRSVLITRLFAKMSYDGAWTQERLIKFVDVVKSSYALRSSMKNLNFVMVPRKKNMGTKFTSMGALVNSFHSLQNLASLTIALPSTGAAKFKRKLIEAAPVVFPNVVDLRIPLNGHFVLLQRPKVRTLSVNWKVSGRKRNCEEKLQIDQEKFRVETVRFKNTLQGCKHVRKQVKTLTLYSVYGKCKPSMMIVLNNLFPETERLQLGVAFVRDNDIPQKLGDALRGWQKLRELELPRIACMLGKSDLEQQCKEVAAQLWTKHDQLDQVSITAGRRYTKRKMTIKRPQEQIAA